jgi:4-hydroxy-3-polyprenylbenzoate decarboxylase
MPGDLRNWLEEVEQHGELKRMSGVHWDLEMSGIYEIVAKELTGPKPVVMFDDIPGCAKGFRTVFGLFGSPRRVAKTLGLPENQTDRMSLLRNWHKKTKDMKPIPPKFVSACNFMDHVEVGAKVDLFKFPVPRFHELDGGRYFGTCHAVIQKEPDTGFVNLGTYRVMLVDGQRLALHILSGQHGSIIMNKHYFARGKKMPVVVALGLDPVLWYTGFTRLPWGDSEYDYAGGIKGEPIEVFKGEVTGLPIPAHAEIVVEGECSPDVTVDEGPFGEWHGYYGNLGLSPVPEPVIEVKAVYYRHDPIMTCQLPARPSLDTSTLPIALSNSSAIWRRLEANGLPGIKGVWCYSEVAGDGLLIVVSIEQMYPGHSREVGLAASQFPHQGRYTIVVEEDIDPSDIEQVIWAMTTRGQPHEAVQVLHHCRSNSADTTIPLQEKLKYKVAPKPLHNSRIVIDACRPLEWQKDWYPLASLSAELRTELLKKWDKPLSKILKKQIR